VKKTTRPALWIPPALTARMPHLAAFFPDCEPVADRARAELIAGEGPAAFEEVGSTPAFNGHRRPVALRVPGLSPEPRHADPFRGTPCEAEEAEAVLALWRTTEAENRRIGAFLHMQRWKRAAIAAAFGHGDGHAPFAENRAAALAAEGPVLAWAARVTQADEAAFAGRELWRVEDGFLRSVGLGVHFAPAASLALDPAGMHYDARRPSRLETLLRETSFDAALRARATLLRAEIVRRGLTKYNIRGGVTGLPPQSGRRRVLVVGQVEDDASICHGAGRIATNHALLRAVRSAEPDAFIAYKPHPDVLTGYRPGAVPAGALRGLADAVVGGDISSLFAEVDAVHTITSLAGFEALLRGVPVVCWGVPFYAGWGLTTDMEPTPRRGRALALDELVAGALILYPRYQDPVTQLPCPPELLLERLSAPGTMERASLWWRVQGRALGVLRRAGVVRG
jgi:capsular polysaccharide export protein